MSSSRAYRTSSGKKLILTLLAATRITCPVDPALLAAWQDGRQVLYVVVVFLLGRHY